MSVTYFTYFYNDIIMNKKRIIIIRLTIMANLIFRCKNNCNHNIAFTK